ncbi:MAG: glycosyltransferase [Acidimicrobiia bacterium]
MLSYVLPLRSSEPRPDLTAYLEWLAPRADVLVVDGSPPDVFATHASWWASTVRHVPVDPARRTPMGKVGGVLTGLAAARHPDVVIADDDVRYDDETLRSMEDRLRHADVVRPQNVFTSDSWHAWWDTGRSLVARALDGDWPGTLGVRRAVLLAAGGYDGDVMFENLELVRTVRAAGGTEDVARDLFVRREPPTAGHFLRQRVRQAYDEIARPVRLAVFLSLGPAVAIGGRRVAIGIAVASVGIAEVGRRRAGGARIFPVACVAAAPLWVAERAVTAWLAVGSRVAFGGIRYGDRIVPRAASSPRALTRRLRSAPACSPRGPGPDGPDVCAPDSAGTP